MALPMFSININALKEQKETNMSQAFNAIKRLADQSLNSELKEHGIAELNGTDIGNAIQEAMAEERKNATKNAAMEIMTLLKEHDNAVASKVEVIRAARQQADGTLATIKHINRAKDYGLETNNFLPLAVLLGKVRASDAGDKGFIPSDWTPKKAATKAVKK